MTNNLPVSLRQNAVKAAFAKMVKRGYFDICTFQESCKLMNITSRGEDEAFLRVLHCVQFNEMQNDVREHTLTIIRETFNFPPDPEPEPAVEKKQEPIGFWKRLTGGK